MNPSGGAATQVCAHIFDQRFHALPKDIQEHLQRRIDELGRNPRDFSHQRLQGVDAFRLRVGDYRIVYEFNMEQNELSDEI